MRRVLLLLFLFYAQTHAAFAHRDSTIKECSRVLFGERIPERPLPAPALEMIDRHAGLRALADRLTADPSLYFSLSHLPDREGQVPDNNKTGELIQALFVRAVLQRAFPNITFHGGERSSSNRPIILTIFDSAEGRINSPGQTPPSDGSGAFLEMSVLKAVNPTGPVAKRDSIRQRLKIPKTYRVVHLYVRKGGAFYAGKLNDAGVNFSKVLHALKQTAQPKQKTVLIVSGLYQSAPDNPQYLYTIDHAAEAMGFGLAIPLSALRDGIAPPIRSHAIIINDTRGWMHEIHAAADIALVIGAINFFEPLNSGTSTIWFQVPDLYDEPTLGRLEQIAHKTRKFVSCQNCGQLEGQLKKLAQPRRPRGLPPYLTELDHSSGRSQFEHFLDHLTQIIERQLSR